MVNYQSIFCIKPFSAKFVLVLCQRLRGGPTQQSISPQASLPARAQSNRACQQVGRPTASHRYLHSEVITRFLVDAVSLREPHSPQVLVLIQSDQYLLCAGMEWKWR